MTLHHYEHLLRRLGQMRPIYRFEGEWAGRPAEWQAHWREQLLALLGEWPPRCDPQPRWEVLQRRERYTLHRVAYATEPGLETFALVGVPHGLKAPAPAVLALHGHGPLGAYPVMCWGEDARLAGQVHDLRYDYGHRLAEAGLVVFAPNLRGFGDRLSERERAAGRLVEQRNIMQQAWMGAVGVNGLLHQQRVALNLLAAMPEVDAGRLGCAGLSYGGRLATFLAAIEPRLRATVVSGALNSLVERIESYASCGYQVVPGLLKYGDTGEVLGLVAPRALAIELGDRDPCAPVARGLAEFDRVHAVYQALGAEDRLRLCRFEGGHLFHGGESIPWLVEQLRGSTAAVSSWS